MSAIRRFKPSSFVLFFALWVALAGGGMAALWAYSNHPGMASTAAKCWPHDSVVIPTAGRATLVMFVHPYCPCSRASIGELALLVRHCREKVSVHVLFLRSAGEGDGWEKTDLWNSANAIPEVRVSVDVGGAEARRFGVSTSGAVVLYGSDGTLLFEGGITGARGHFGDNVGRDSVTALLNGSVSGPLHSFVFGCDLFDAMNNESPTPGKVANSCCP